MMTINVCVERSNVIFSLNDTQVNSEHSQENGDLHDDDKCLCGAVERYIDDKFYGTLHNKIKQKVKYAVEVN